MRYITFTIWALTAVFLATKLLGYLTWSYWMIFAPIWMSVVTNILVILIKKIKDAY